MTGEKIISRILIIVCTFTTAVFLWNTVPAYAYGSWVRGTGPYNAAVGAEAMPSEGIEEGTDITATIQSHPDDTDPDTTEKMWSKILVGWGTGISKALKGGTIDASITGITMGKIVNGVNYFVFDLTDQNPYGVIGSVIYVTFRHLCLAIVFLFVLWRIVIGGIFSDKGGAALKGAVYSLIIFLFLLYCMPLIVDWVCELRDFMSKEIFLRLGSVVSGHTDGLKSTLSLEDEYLQVYNDSKTTLDALIYFAVCLTPILYSISYIKIALTVLTMFGLFPLFVTVSVRDPKQLSNWSSIMFANLFVPMVDLLILLIPTLIISLIEAVAGDIAKTTLKAVLVVMMLINAIAAREIVLKMFGNSLGIEGGLGAIGAAGAIAGMAKKAFGAAKEALGGGGNRDGSDGDDMSKGEADSRDAEASKSLKDTYKPLPELGGSGDGNGGDGDGGGDGGSGIDGGGYSSGGGDNGDGTPYSTSGEEDGNKGMEDIEPLQGNELDFHPDSEQDSEGNGDEGEDGYGTELNTPEELGDIPVSGGGYAPQDWDTDGSDGYDPGSIETGDQFIEAYGSGESRPDIEGVQRDGDIGGELGDGEKTTATAEISDLGGREEIKEVDVPGKEPGEVPVQADWESPASIGGDLAGKEEVSGNIGSVEDNAAPAVAPIGGGLSGKEEVRDNIGDNMGPVEDNAAPATASIGGGLSGKEEVRDNMGPVEVYNGKDLDEGDMQDTGKPDVPENPLESMRKDEAPAEQLSTVQSQADKAIADATVKPEDLETSTGGKNKYLADTVENTLPGKEGAKNDLDRQINMSRAANLQTLDNLRAKSEMLSKDDASARQTIESNSGLIQNNTARLKDLDRAEKVLRSNYTDQNGNDFSSDMSEQDKRSLDRIQNERSQVEASTRNAENNISAAKERIATNSGVQQHLSAEIDRCRSTEAQIADIQEKRGMSGKKFNSVGEYTRQLEHDSNLRKTMSYKNYTKEKYSGVLTPQEKQQFQRQLNIRRSVSATARFAGNVVGGAAMTVVGAGAIVALSGLGKDGVQIGADIMATGIGKVGAGVAQPVNAAGKGVKQFAGDVVAMGAGAAGGKASQVGRFMTSGTDSAWAEHQRELQKPNEDIPMVTRAELESRQRAGNDAQRDPKEMPLSNIPGTEEAKMFREQMMAGAGDPEVRERYRTADRDARKAVDDYERLRNRNKQT